MPGTRADAGKIPDVHPLGCQKTLQLPTELGAFRGCFSCKALFKIRNLKNGLKFA
jgi:hypothetical protein